MASRNTLPCAGKGGVACGSGAAKKAGGALERWVGAAARDRAPLAQLAVAQPRGPGTGWALPRPALQGRACLAAARWGGRGLFLALACHAGLVFPIWTRGRRAGTTMMAPRRRKAGTRWGRGEGAVQCSAVRAGGVGTLSLAVCSCEKHCGPRGHVLGQDGLRLTSRAPAGWRFAQRWPRARNAK